MADHEHEPGDEPGTAEIRRDDLLRHRVAGVSQEVARHGGAGDGLQQDDREDAEADQRCPSRR
jgi:hypothetical protein